jgi:Domain of unknown function (DUF4272)
VTDPERWRADSVAALTPYGFALPPHFPLLDVGPHRPLEQVIARAQALVCVLNAAHGAPLEKVERVLDEHGLHRWVSEIEREFLDDPGDQRAARVLTWRVEALYALTWVLQVADALPLQGTVRFGEELLGPVDPLSATPAPTALRDRWAVAARLDLFFCAHWAVRENHLTGSLEPWPAELVGGAIEERRHALEWCLAPDEEWDEVSLDT